MPSDSICFSSLPKFFLTYQIYMTYQYMGFPLQIFVSNFPDVCSILTHSAAIRSVPTDMDIMTFKKELSPSIENKDFKFCNISSLNDKYIVKFISIRCKRIRNINQTLKTHKHIICGFTSVFIYKNNLIGCSFRCRSNWI